MSILGVTASQSAGGPSGGGGGLTPNVHVNAVLAVTFNGDDEDTTAVDLSASEHEPAFAGDAQIDTAITKFGSGSLLLGGAGYVDIPAGTTDFDFGTGAFAIEFWLYVVTTTPTQQILLSHSDFTNDQQSWELQYFNNNLIFTRGTNGGLLNTVELTWPLASIGTGWHHIAITEDGTVGDPALKLFVDGLLVDTDSGGTFLTFNNPLRVGARANPTPSLFFVGNIEDLQIVKSAAKYTANFTPPAQWWNEAA